MENEKYQIEKLFLSINKIFDNIGFDEYFLKEFYKKNIKDLINLFQNNINTNIDIFTIYCYELLINISKESKYDNFSTKFDYKKSNINKNTFIDLQKKINNFNLFFNSFSEQEKEEILFFLKFLNNDLNHIKNLFPWNKKELPFLSQEYFVNKHIYIHILKDIHNELIKESKKTSIDEIYSKHSNLINHFHLFSEIIEKNTIDYELKNSLTIVNEPILRKNNAKL